MPLRYCSDRARRADWLREGESKIDALAGRVDRSPNGAKSREEFFSGSDR
jgi:hypothetical protein